MRKAVEFFVKYPIWANSIIAAVVLFGGIAFFVKLKKSFFPERDPSSISIAVAMPGAAPEEMEEGVSIKIEEALKGMEGIDEINSTSSENTATVTINLLKGFDPDLVLSEVKNAVDGISSFPVSAERPIITKVKPRSMAVSMSLSGDVDLKTLKQFAERIESDLLASGVMSQVAVSGYPSLEISIEVSESQLSRHGLDFTQVAAAVRNNNRDISAGSIKARDEEILIRSRAQTKDADRIGDIVLRASPDGTKLYLRDVATVKEQFADVPNKLFVNGKRAVSFTVNKLPEEDLEQITNFTKAYIADFNNRSEGVSLIIRFDFMGLLQERLDMLLNNGAVGLGLVVVVLGLFLSVRVSFWVAAGIPISFLGMLFLGTFLGVTINMISLFGMILVVGILVDDGIVIAENIFSHFEKGKSPFQAAVDGTVEVMPAVFTSVLTTIVAFVPLFFLDGFEFYQEMAIVVIVCLAFSLVEAFFVLPAHMASPAILSRKKENKVRRILERSINFMRVKVYGKALAHILNYRYIYLAIPFAFIMVINGLMKGGIINTTFFPRIPFDSFQVDLAFKAGTREAMTQEYLTDIDRKIWEVNQEAKAEFGETEDFVSNTFLNVGRTSDGLENGGHAGNINVNLQGLDNRRYISSFEIANRVRSKIGDIPEAEKLTVGGRDRWGKPVSISLFSKNNDELNSAKEDLKQALKNFPILKDINDNMRLGSRELQLELKPKAYFLGLTHSDITTQIRQGFFGEEVQRLQKGPDEVRVWVRYPEKDRFTVGQLEQMKVKTIAGQEIPISEVAYYSVGRGLVDIKRYNGAREVVVDAELEDPFAPVPEIIEKINQDIIPVLKAKYPGIDVAYGGQQRNSTRSLNSFMAVFPGLVFIMILLVALTFRSFSQAFLIFSMIPIALACAVLGHGIEGKPVSLLSLWGMLALSGVIINDSVVLLDKFNRNMKEGMPLVKAVFDAGLSRFRPILLTSATTVAGLYPLIMEKSFQAQFLIPMAVSMAYGVLFGTLFCLLFFPVFIVVVNDLRRAASWAVSYLACLWSGSYGSLEYPLPEIVEPAIREKKRIAANA